MSNPGRAPLYLLTGLILGIVLGVLYAWLWIPVDAFEASPAVLRDDFKDAYRELIARAYISNSDLGRAESRLALLGDADPARELAVQAQLTLGQDGAAEAARALGILAAHIKGGQDSAAIEIAYPETPTPGNVQAPTSTPGQNSSNPGGSNETTSAGVTPTPRFTITPQASATPTATQGAPFSLVDYALVCDEDISPPQIQVFVFDASGNPVPGVGIVITWDGGVNRFVTGLKPEFGLGYADYEMQPALSYTIRLEGGGDPVDGLTGRECEGGYWGTWRLNFTQS
ncbi:MAG: hypothetical protein ABFS17_06060 [Chloroflexota bacterium]